MKIIECPRDAMQGLVQFIETEKKIQYLTALLKVGFDTIDAGSFVSAKAIPQMRDTATVIDRVDLSSTSSKLLVIVANKRGAEEASQFSNVSYMGFPLSLSETFQQRNTNKSIGEALNELAEIKNICDKSGKKLVAYISMGFGNPYGDPYDVSLVGKFVDVLVTLGADVISLADTIGVSTPENIRFLFSTITREFPTTELGAHLHSEPSTAREKIQAAFESGCVRFDGAIRGFGGCPMAKSELVGNMATETIVDYLDSQSASPKLNREAFAAAQKMADAIFPAH